jgi:hypothetical protein
MSMTFTPQRLHKHSDGSVVYTKIDAPLVNMSNRNASTVLRYLGYEAVAEQFYGTIPAPDLAGKCKEALALLRSFPELDCPPPSQDHAHPQRWIEFDMPAGYLQLRIGHVLALSTLSGVDIIVIG